MRRYRLYLFGQRRDPGSAHREIAAQGLEDEIKVVQTGCFGCLCALGPIMIVYPEGVFLQQGNGGRRSLKSLRNTSLKGRPVERLIYKEEENETEEQILNSSLSNTQFYKKQLRVALRNCGVINPEKHRRIYRDGRLFRACEGSQRDDSRGRYKDYP